MIIIDFKHPRLPDTMKIPGVVSYQYQRPLSLIHLYLKGICLTINPNIGWKFHGYIFSIRSKEGFKTRPWAPKSSEIQEILDLRVHTRFWNGHRTVQQLADKSNSVIPGFHHDVTVWKNIGEIPQNLNYKTWLCHWKESSLRLCKMYT